MQEVRIEKDSMGEMEVDNSKYWGAQTQRSYNNFPIGIEKMPKEITKAFAYLKQACAATNFSFGKLDERRYKAITQACQDVLQGKLCRQLPARRLADGLWHAVQHEHERSDCQPRHRNYQR